MSLPNDASFSPRLHRNAKQAFNWLIPILQKHRIPYLISGGFAAKIYGAKRPLIDIDVDIPEERFAELLADFSKYVVYGPKMWQGEGFKVYLMTLEYHGQPIDIGGSHLTKLWHRKKHAWVQCKSQLTHYTWKYILHHRVRVMDKQELIVYKRALDRRVDKKDLTDLQ